MSSPDTLKTSSPAKWQADDESHFCGQCQDVFTFLKRRHHCRVCGKLFCADCSSSKILIPRELFVSLNDDASIPQRACGTCSRALEPMQAHLRATVSKANSVVAIDRDANDRYLNSILSYSLEDEIKKATFTLLNFTSDNIIEGRDRIPRELLLGARGIAFLTIGKLGFFITGRFGTGMVISRLGDGSWSAPSALMVTGLGWGFQFGGEVTDVILILTSPHAVEAFSSKAQVSMGTELAVSLGPVGRSAGTDLHAGDQGASAAFSYAHSKGLFVGMSLEASVIASRPDVNRAFYGQDVKPAVLLSGEFPRPKAAEPLYKALSEVLTDVDPSPLPRYGERIFAAIESAEPEADRYSHSTSVATSEVGGDDSSGSTSKAFAALVGLLPTPTGATRQGGAGGEAEEEEHKEEHLTAGLRGGAPARTGRSIGPPSASLTGSDVSLGAEATELKEFSARPTKGAEDTPRARGYGHEDEDANGSDDDDDGGSNYEEIRF